jgi:tetratricopeptide (TPR) repeat protein
MGDKIMKKAIYIMLVMSFLPALLAAQTSLPHTNKAAKLYHNGDLIAAKAEIEYAITSAVENEHAYTWYVRGFIYKEFYKQIEKKSKLSENREIAVESIQKSIQLDKQGRYIENNKLGIEYLATTYYNDAILLVESITADDYVRPISSYESYKSTVRIVEPYQDFSRSDVEFYSMLASAVEELYLFSGQQDKDLLEAAQSYYKKALQIDPEDYTANYNMAINYYNRGVFLIKGIDYKTEIFELMLIQDECLDLFRLSLPFMKKAHDLRPERKETLYGLMAIYRALNDYEKSDFYLGEIERLIKEGVIKE